jgi:hypothetical protein
MGGKLNKEALTRALTLQLAQALDELGEIDSVVVVEILCGLAELIPFELQAEDVVKEGGFQTVDEALAYMLPRLEKAAHKNGVTI